MVGVDDIRQLPPRYRSSMLGRDQLLNTSKGYLNRFETKYGPEKKRDQTCEILVALFDWGLPVDVFAAAVGRTDIQFQAAVDWLVRPATAA